MKSVPNGSQGDNAHLQVPDGVAQAPVAALALKLFSFLDERDVPYVVVGDVRYYQRAVASDIDIVVSEAALPAMARLVAEFAGQHGGRLVQAIRHERAAVFFVLAHVVNGERVFLHPDVCAAYVRRGRRLMDASELLRDRGRHPLGFAVPATDRAFGYYVLKKVDKGALDLRAFGYLQTLYANDPVGCRAWLAPRLSNPHLDVIKEAFENEDLDGLVRALPSLRRAIERSAPIPAMDRWRELTRAVERWVRPTGTWVAFYGPDGVGKSSVIEAIEKRLGPAFRRVRRYHLRPHLGRRPTTAGAPVTDPHARSPRGRLTSVAKAAYWWWDAVAGYWVDVRWRLVRSTLVVFDRYVDDLAVDPRRYRFGGPKWLVELLRRATPRPDLTVVLDAPADVLQARKAEVAPKESERQGSAYRSLAARARQAVVVDASAPLDEVARCVEVAILDYLEARTRRRLGLT